MYQVMTLLETLCPDMESIRTKVLISGCVLDDRLTLEQLSNNEFRCTRDKRDLPAGMLFVQKSGS